MFYLHLANPRLKEKGIKNIKNCKRSADIRLKAWCPFILRNSSQFVKIQSKNSRLYLEWVKSNKIQKKIEIGFYFIMILFGRSTIPTDYISGPLQMMPNTKLTLAQATTPISSKVCSKGGFGGLFPIKVITATFAGLNLKSTASSKNRLDLKIRSKKFMRGIWKWNKTWRANLWRVFRRGNKRFSTKTT